MRHGRAKRYVDRQCYIGFRCPDQLRKMVEHLAGRANKEISELMNDWATEGANRLDADLRRKEQMRFAQA